MKDRFLKQINDQFPIQYLMVKMQYEQLIDVNSEEFNIIKKTHETTGLPSPIYKKSWPGIDLDYYILKQELPHQDIEFVNRTIISQFRERNDNISLKNLSIVKIPEGYESVLVDITKISIFLQNENAVLAQLKKLNTLLMAEAKKQGFSIEELKDNLKHKKLLRNVLERELEKLGFYPKFGKALELLTPEVFLSLLRARIIIKDPGAGKNHGEFTHAIQWLIIAWQQNDFSFLSKPAVEIFINLGDKDKNGNLAWDFALDAILEKSSRTPDYLNNLIMNSEDPDLALLQVLCSTRYKKRDLGLFTSEKKYPNETYDLSDYAGVLLPKMR